LRLHSMPPIQREPSTFRCSEDALIVGSGAGYGQWYAGTAARDCAWDQSIWQVNSVVPEV
jgi:hypothetical protein